MADQKRMEEMKTKLADSHASRQELKPLSVGDTVSMQPIQHGKRDWTTVTKRIGDRSYEVPTPTGRPLRRNRLRLRRALTTTQYIDTYDDTFYEGPPTESCPQPAEPAQLTGPHEMLGPPTEPAQMPEPHETHITPPAAESRTRSGRTVKKPDRLIQTM